MENNKLILKGVFQKFLKHNYSGRIYDEDRFNRLLKKEEVEIVSKEVDRKITELLKQQ
jgi:hypothetical protein